MKAKKGQKIDRFFLGIVVVLVLIGIAALASVSSTFSQERFGKSTVYLFHQIGFGLLAGLVLGFVAYKIPLEFLRKKSLIIVLAALGLMALVFIPQLSIISGGASRWINFGFVSFQPSEFLKVAFVLYIASWLSSRTREKPKKNKKNWEFTSHPFLKKGEGFTLLPFLIILGLITLLLILQSDLSTLGVIVAIAVLMYFASGTPVWHNVLILLLGLGGLFFLIRFVPYRMKRFLAFLNPRFEPMGIGYQIKQALIAVGSGGIFGLGLGMSYQKFGYLPQAMSDSIFAIFAEETGFIGCSALVVLFLLFLWRGFRIGKRCQDKFSKLMVLGVTSWICIQGFINIGAMIGILPLTGIPLPFISYGGSHIVAELIGVGIILNISKNRRK